MSAGQRTEEEVEELLLVSITQQGERLLQIG